MIRSLLLAAGLAASGLPAIAQVTRPAAAEGPVRLTADEMRALARDLLAEGQPSAAGEVLNALLSRDPNDASALILGAQAALDQNAPAAAVDLATRGFGATDDPRGRYVAARLAALAHVEQGHFTRSQIWLRRARQYAPDAESAAEVARDYGFVRDRNPLSVDLSFGASPSSNVNNGSRSDTANILGLDLVLSEAAKALSGIEYNAGGELRYRLAADDRSATYAQVEAQTTTYTLSPESRRALQRDVDAARASGRPTADLPDEGSDFAYSTLAVSLIHNRILTEGARPTTFTIRAGTSWYGGDPYQDFVDLGVGHVVDIDNRSQVRLNLDLQKQFAQDSFQDTFSYGLGVTYRRVLDNDDLLSLSVADRVNRSDDTERDYNSFRIGVGYDLAQPIRDIRFGFGASVEQRGYDLSFYTQAGRIDRTVAAQVTAVFDNIEYYGFRPAVTLSVGRTYTDADRFETQYGNIGFDLQSAF